MIIEKVAEYAVKQGFITVEYFGEWNGYKVYTPIIDPENVAKTGFPQRILVKGDNIRMATDKEVYAIWERG